MAVRPTSVRCIGRRREDLLRIDTPVTSVELGRPASPTSIQRKPSMSKRLEEVIDGRLQSAEPDRPVISSAQTAWCGFPLERNVCHDGRAGSILFPYTELIMVVVGTLGVECRASGIDQQFCAGEGSVTLWPAGYQLSSVSWNNRPPDSCTAEILRIQLDMSALVRLSPQDDPIAGVRLAPQCAILDPALASLMRLMEMDIASGCPGGNLYGESLSIALATHVATRYSTGSIEVMPHNGLARAVLVRVLEYIYANLGRDLTITELAAVANMSPHHFSLCFKRSLGVAPHQWVVRARVREAGRLLRTRSMSVAEVALTLGFASQTHFTDVFRRATGTTPHHYRRLC